MRLFREMQPGLHTPRHMRSGVIGVIVIGFLLTTAMTRRVPFWPKGGEVVKVELRSGINLNGTTPVRVRGIEVGRVDKVERNPSGRGVVASLRITDDGVKLHRDAHASVHYRTLLGLNMSIDIDPGSPSAPVLAGALPLEQTEVQPEIDEVLRPLDATARGAIQTSAKEFDRAFASPDAVGSAADAMQPGLRSIAKGLPGLRGTAPGHDLPGLVSSANRTMAALSRDEIALGGLIDHADVTLGVTAARGSEISSTLQRSPAALEQTRATMTRLRTTLGVLDPLAAALLPGARELDSTSTATRAALARLTPLLRSARPTLVDLASTARVLRDDVAGQGAELVKQLTPAVDRTQSDILPFLNAKDDVVGKPNYQSIGPTIAHADSLTSGFDAYGHHIVFEPSGGSRTMKGGDCTSTFLDLSETKLLNCQAVFDMVKRLLGGGSSGKLKAHPATRRSGR